MNGLKVLKQEVFTVREGHYQQFEVNSYNKRTVQIRNIKIDGEYALLEFTEFVHAEEGE